MKFVFFLPFLMITIACNNNKSKVVSIKQFQKNEYWLEDFKNSNLSSVTFAYKNDKLYANTIEIASRLNNYFYCFDLQSGKVLWANEVSAHSSYRPIVLNDIIYYVTYTGDRYAFDTLGNELWNRNFSNQRDVNLSLSGITFNPINHNLILTDVIGGFYEFDKKNGNKVSYITPSDSASLVLPKPVFIGNFIYYTNNCYKSIKKLPPKFPYNSIICQDYYTKKVKWIKPFHVKELHSENGNIFFYRKDSLFSLNGETGNINWRLPLDTLQNYRVLFMKDRILCRLLDGKVCGVDYDTGNKISYIYNKRIIEYLLSDNHNKNFKVRITLGSFNSNEGFDDACEIQVEKTD